MEIQDWLQGTADAHQHTPTSHRPALSIQAPSANAVILQRKNSRKRRRSTSTSSVHLLQVRQRRGKRSTDHSDGKSYQSEHDPYRRRKRRKTRGDRYEVKNKPKGKHDDWTKNERKKSKRRVNGEAESAIVKEYMAKNVSASRLTV